VARKAGNLREKFIIEYLIDLNATQAAIRAGYSPNTAKSQGQRLLTNVDLRKKIDEALDEQAKRVQLTADYVLTGLIEVADRCRQAVPVLNREGNETGEWKFDSTGANKALELLGKHLALFTDKIEFATLDTEIERQLARMAASSEAEISGTSEGDTHSGLVN
jgi:phage terminase small subunit